MTLRRNLQLVLSKQLELVALNSMFSVVSTLSSLHMISKPIQHELVLHEITHLLDCVPLDQISYEHSYPSIMGFPVYESTRAIF